MQDFQDVVQDLASLASKILARLEYSLQDWVISLEIKFRNVCWYTYCRHQNSGARGSKAHPILPVTH